MREILNNYLYKTRNAVSILLYGFCISTFIMPVASINKIFFVFLLLYTFLSLLAKNKFLSPTPAPFIIISIFIFGFINSLNKNANLDLAFQFMSSTSILLLVYLIYDNRIDMSRIVKHCGVIMVVATFIYYALFLIHDRFYIASKLFVFFNKYGLGAVGYRTFFSKPMLMIHIGTIPFIFVPASLYLVDFLKMKKMNSLIMVVTMVYMMILSTSRGLIIAYILCAIILVIYQLRGRKRTVMSGILLTGIILSGLYISNKSSVFSLSEVSNSIKIGHIMSFIENLSLKNVLLGDGLASYYFSRGVNRLLAHTEVTGLDMVRYFGFILTAVLYYSLVFPCGRSVFLSEKTKQALIIFLIYIVLSMTNPVFFNSFGAVVILWYWSIVIDYKSGVVQLNE